MIRKLSDYCLVTRERHLYRLQGNYSPVAFVKRALFLIDDKMRFTGLEGLAWRLCGVSRYPKNPNICNG